MFQMFLLHHKNNKDVVKAIEIRCSNFHRKTCLHLKGETIEEIITNVC